MRPEPKLAHEWLALLTPLLGGNDLGRMDLRQLARIFCDDFVGYVAKA
jgi:hypothetical protein